jgi:hypothetical protein
MPIPEGIKLFTKQLGSLLVDSLASICSGLFSNLTLSIMEDC